MKEFKGTKERICLISSGEKDYFKIEGEETCNTLAYLNVVSLQFNDHQIELQNIVASYNKLFKVKKELLKALQDARKELLQNGFSKDSRRIRSIDKTINKALD